MHGPPRRDPRFDLLDGLSTSNATPQRDSGEHSAAPDGDGTALRRRSAGDPPSIRRSGMSHIAATVAYSPTEIAGTKNAIGIAVR